MVTFKQTGSVNTDDAIAIGLNYAAQNNLDFIIATSTGATALAAVKKAKEIGYHGRVIAVTHVYRQDRQNEMPEEVRTQLQQQGAVLVTAAHALSAGERGISTVYHGMYPLELIAATLRLFGNGTKVALECSLMAADAGAVAAGHPVVAVGGTHSGADTACLITPGCSADLFTSKINEILCKPSLLNDSPVQPSPKK